MPSRGPHKYCCKVCKKNFPSGRALGGHMSSMSTYQHAGKQPKNTPIPPVNVVDLPVLLLGPSDEKSSLSSLETHFLRCSKELTSYQSLRGNMRMQSEKEVMAKPDEEPKPAGLMEALADANGDHRHNVMLFSPVRKRKRSKRGMPLLDSEVDAAIALLMLAGNSDMTSAFEDCSGGDKDDSVSKPEVLKEVNLNAFGQLIQSDEFGNNTMLKSDKNSAYEGLYEHCEKENSFNLAAFVPNKMVLLNVFDHGLDGDAEFMKPGANISVDEVKSGELSVAVKIKRCQCDVCGKLRSGYAMGCHMCLHCEKENSLNLAADVPQKDLLLNLFGHRMDVDGESTKPGAHISVDQLKSSDVSGAVNIKKHQCKVCGKLLRSGQALGGHMTLHSHFGKENKLNLFANVPKEEVLVNVVDHGDVGVEFMKKGAAISVEELKSSDLSASVNLKVHPCKVCVKVLSSGHALGGHMRLHYVRKCNVHQGVADCPDSVTMEEQVQKLEVKSPIFYRRRRHSHESKI